MLHVVFARPDYLDRPFDHARDFGRFLHEIAFCSAPEPSAEEGRVDVCIIDAHTSRLRGHLPSASSDDRRTVRKLRGRPDGAAPFVHPSRAVHRLHRRMREVGQAINCLVCGSRRGQSRRGIPLVTYGPSTLPGFRLQVREDVGVIESGCLPLIPVDEKCVPSGLGRDVPIGHDGDPRLDLNHLTDAGNGERCRRIERTDRSTEHGATSDHRDPCLWGSGVDPENRSSGTLGLDIEPCHRSTDDTEFRGVFEQNVLRDIQK